MYCLHIILYLTSDSRRHTLAWTMLQKGALLDKGPEKHSRWCPHQAQRSPLQASDGQVVVLLQAFPSTHPSVGDNSLSDSLSTPPLFSNLSKREMSCRPCKGCCWGTLKPHTSIPGKFWPSYHSGPQPISNFSSFLYLALSLIHNVSSTEPGQKAKHIAGTHAHSFILKRPKYFNQPTQHS